MVQIHPKHMCRIYRGRSHTLLRRSSGVTTAYYRWHRSRSHNPRSDPTSAALKCLGSLVGKPVTITTLCLSFPPLPPCGHELQFLCAKGGWNIVSIQHPLNCTPHTFQECLWGKLHLLFLNGNEADEDIRCVLVNSVCFVY